MFKNIFSFSGRIRRTEYWLTGPLIWLIMIPITIAASFTVVLLFFIWIIPLWISFASAVKRSHDMGNSGLLILLPIYNPFFLAFGGSQPFTNQYGVNPKGININSNDLHQSIIINNHLNQPGVNSDLETSGLKPNGYLQNNFPKNDVPTFNKNINNPNNNNEPFPLIEDVHLSKITQLKNLKQLFDDGILTQEEYDELKSKIL